VIYYQYKADRARRTLRGIDEQVTKAERYAAREPGVFLLRWFRGRTAIDVMATQCNGPGRSKRFESFSG
jgi:hypothetical protein